MSQPVDPQNVIVRERLAGEVPFYRENGQAQPRSVNGIFRSTKFWLMGILLAWWHLGPFLRWDRGPDAPGQAILVDMAGRRAYFFDIEIWPQEVYYITGILLIAAITLFLMSAVAGRLWCGFLCWQTVYTDLFQQVERLILGDRNARIALSRAPFSVDKWLRKGLVVAIWAVISAACGIGVTLWFGDAPQMLKDIFTLNAPSAAYLFIGIIGGFCFLLGGFARERVCVYMCPYSRFQSAMLDEHSMVISYESWRGEPRAAAPKDLNFADRGHCVDCKACVQSCPTGVDIRWGNQLACIGCGLCIDACDKVMDKFGLPKGLIRYDSSANLEARTKGQTPPGLRPMRLRTLLYVALLGLVGAIMLFSLLTRSTTEVNVLHERSPLYVQLSDGAVRNGYAYKILNMIREERVYVLTIEGLPGATLEQVGGQAGVTSLELPADKDQVATYRLFVNAPADSLTASRQSFRFVLTEKDKKGKPVINQTLFVGPDK